jgi:flagellar assembly protein FliH
LNPHLNRQLKEMEARVMQEVGKRAVQIEHEAYEKGFAQGEKDGLETGQKRLEVVVRQVGLVLKSLERRREELFLTFERELIDFAFCVISKILRREALLSEGVIKDTLRAAFARLESNRRIVLHVNPIDFKYLLAHPDQLPFVLQDRERIKILEDDTVSVGGCLLETDYGIVDATLEGQFDEIVNRIKRDHGLLPAGENPL